VSRPAFEAEEASFVDLTGPDDFVEEEVVAAPAGDRLDALTPEIFEQLGIEGTLGLIPR
jgi:hypothetical protein